MYRASSLLHIICIYIYFYDNRRHIISGTSFLAPEGVIWLLPNETEILFCKNNISNVTAWRVDTPGPPPQRIQQYIHNWHDVGMKFQVTPDIELQLATALPFISSAKILFRPIPNGSTISCRRSVANNQAEEEYQNAIFSWKIRLLVSSKVCLLTNCI